MKRNLVARKQHGSGYLLIVHRCDHACDTLTRSLFMNSRIAANARFGTPVITLCPQFANCSNRIRCAVVPLQDALTCFGTTGEGNERAALRGYRNLADWQTKRMFVLAPRLHKSRNWGVDQRPRERTGRSTQLAGFSRG